LGAGGTQANAVNDLQQVVGGSAGHAFLYAGGTLSDLGAFGGQQTVAYGINNLSQIVGDYVVGGGAEGQSFHGWVCLGGQLYDLNGLLDPAAQSWTIIDARGINDAGQIIATAVNPSQSNGTFAVILTPDQSLFNASDTPAFVTWNDARAVELGVKFQSAVAGRVTGVRFYKGPQNTGTHVGTLWSATGTVLASATFTEETSSGWQQVNFSNPVPITPGTVYIVSYHTDIGFYSADGNYFATAHPSGPLAAPDSTSSGGNGVYAYGSGCFPTNTCNATNYWVDLVFVAN
jgi:probable HAF family extracellular repeat protein